jgi:hypothetical protein
VVRAFTMSLRRKSPLSLYVVIDIVNRELENLLPRCFAEIPPGFRSYGSDQGPSETMPPGLDSLFIEAVRVMVDTPS